jgi:hypothetical protein
VHVVLQPLLCISQTNDAPLLHGRWQHHVGHGAERAGAPSGGVAYTNFDLPRKARLFQPDCTTVASVRKMEVGKSKTVSSPPPLPSSGIIDGCIAYYIVVHLQWSRSMRIIALQSPSAHCSSRW